MKKDYAKIREQREREKLAADEVPPLVKLDVYEVTNCEKLNLRVAPGSVSDVIKVLDKGTRLIELEPRRFVPPLASGDAFVHVQLESDHSVEGYCMEVYLKRVG